MKHILVSQRVDVIENYKERRDALDQKWVELLWETGYTGLPVPNHNQAVMEILNSVSVDGIVLSGGNTPVNYGGSAPERDTIDETLISYAVKQNIPLMGICRGMQSIVLFFKGTLRKTKGHVAVRHNLNNNRNVNSYHEFAPDTVPDELSIIARAEDNEIEYIIHRDLPILGIMWHPERETPFVKDDMELICNFFGKES